MDSNACDMDSSLIGRCKLSLSELIKKDQKQRENISQRLDLDDSSVGFLRLKFKYIEKDQINEDFKKFASNNSPVKV
eukprot:CAMPEP_0116954006 /NCGR_PEP_ID=MMETSP0467-20121206/41645_1 /TAXON_ID=283647 /ORGANISM="Mesodinium pulex, Strain SPMC105" /LENGTH=76 /DNA_ID=CAMNT_0004639535 /DNA_START=198 /DNA_END=428 /DNA_ORIENTATION=-